MLLVFCARIPSIRGTTLGYSRVELITFSFVFIDLIVELIRLICESNEDLLDFSDCKITSFSLFKEMSQDGNKKTKQVT